MQLVLHIRANGILTWESEKAVTLVDYSKYNQLCGLDICCNRNRKSGTISHLWNWKHQSFTPLAGYFMNSCWE